MAVKFIMVFGTLNAKIILQVMGSFVKLYALKELMIIKMVLVKSLLIKLWKDWILSVHLIKIIIMGFAILNVILAMIPLITGVLFVGQTVHRKKHLTVGQYALKIMRSV